MGKIPIILCKIGQKTSEKVIRSTAFHKFVAVPNFTLARLGKERLVKLTHFKAEGRRQKTKKVTFNTRACYSYVRI